MTTFRLTHDQATALAVELAHAFASRYDEVTGLLKNDAADITVTVDGTTEFPEVPTAGEIATYLVPLKHVGVTRDVVQYVTDRVWWDEAEREAEARAEAAWTAHQRYPAPRHHHPL